MENKSVLIVTESFREVSEVRAKFEIAGWTVADASDFSEGLRKIVQGGIDLLVCECEADLRAVDEIISSAKAKSATPLDVIVIVDETIDSAEVLTLGGAAVFSRPIEAGAILSVAKRLLDAPEERVKRKNERINCIFPVIYKDPITQQTVNSVLSNLGQTGLFIVVGNGEFPELFETIEFTFCIDPENIEVSGKGIVRRIRESGPDASVIGFGIEFFEFLGNGQEAVDAWFKRSYVPEKPPETA